MTLSFHLGRWCRVLQERGSDAGAAAEEADAGVEGLAASLRDRLQSAEEPAVDDDVDEAPAKKKSRLVDPGSTADKVVRIWKLNPGKPNASKNSF